MASALLNDPDGAKLRERHERARRFCVDCGEPCSWPGATAKEESRCLSCRAEYQRVWDEETVIEALQRYAAEHGQPKAQKWLTNRPEGMPPVHTIQRVFGSWNEGLRAAGLRTLPPGHKWADRAQREAA